MIWAGPRPEKRWQWDWLPDEKLSPRSRTNLRNTHVNVRSGKRGNHSKRKNEKRGEHCDVFWVDKKRVEGVKRVRDADSDGWTDEGGMKEGGKRGTVEFYMASDAAIVPEEMRAINLFWARARASRIA